jgi:hypothetical protein
MYTLPLPTQNKQIEQMLAQISFVKKGFKSRLLVKTTKGMHYPLKM